MKISERFERELNLISRDERGFYDRRLADGWIARVRHASVRVTYPMGTDSYDATERHEFADGSSIEVGNPDQTVFSIDIME